MQNSHCFGNRHNIPHCYNRHLGHFLIKARENETRRLQLIRDHTALQIAEFYAPLSALTEQLDAAATIGDSLVVPEDERTKVNDLIFAHSFSATHREIFQILKTKLHLAEEDKSRQASSGIFTTTGLRTFKVL